MDFSSKLALVLCCVQTTYINGHPNTYKLYTYRRFANTETWSNSGWFIFVCNAQYHSLCIEYLCCSFAKKFADTFINVILESLEHINYENVLIKYNWKWIAIVILDDVLI